MSQLVTKVRLAEMAGVSKQEVTRLLKGRLAVALSGDRINMAHAAVVDYLEFRKEVVAKATASGKPKPKKDGQKAALTKSRKKATDARAAKAAEIQARIDGRNGDIALPKKRKAAVELHRDDEGDEGDGWRMPTMLEETAQDINVDPEQIEHMTLMQLGTRFGTRQGLLDYIKAIKDLEDIKAKRIKNARERGTLIPRDEVRKMFSFVENAHSRVIADTPPRLSTSIFTMLDDETTKEDIEEMVRKQVSSQLKGVKEKVARAFTRIKKQAITEAQANAAT